jgi:hypothetical protein
MQRLSEFWNLDSRRLDFVDIDLDDDLPLYVDPLLFWRSPHPEHHAVHAYLLRFFEKSLEHIKAGRADVAKQMCHFSEPENLIGRTESGHSGHGISRDLGDKILNELLYNTDIQEHGLKFLNEFQLMVEGIGPDLISDMTVNIAKRYFVHYTNHQCELYNLRVETTTTRVFIEHENTWDDTVVELPLHPATGRGFLLTPVEVVRRIVGLDSGEVYQSFLRHILRGRMIETFSAFGKPARITWKQVKAEYPFSKGFVVKMLHEEPKLRRDYTGSLKPERRQRGEELTLERMGMHVGPQHPISFDVVQELTSTKFQDTNISTTLATIVKGAPSDGSREFGHALSDEIHSLAARTSEELVVVLGSYSASVERAFEQCQSFLTDNGYTPAIIRDLPDVTKKNPRQKLFTYSCLARFIVVLDYAPSGHLIEIELLKDAGVPMAIVSSTSAGTTAMLQGIDFAHGGFIKRFSIREGSSLLAVMEEVVDWAEGSLRASRTLNSSELPWLTE